jgi:hypothetical protein
MQIKRGEMLDTEHGELKNIVASSDKYKSSMASEHRLQYALYKEEVRNARILDYISAYEPIENSKGHSLANIEILSEADLKFASKLEMPDRFMQDKLK